MDKQVTVGRIVHYIVSDNDSDFIKSGGVKAGDVLSALVLRVFDGHVVNLRVFCDGLQDDYKTSVKYGDEHGNWHWAAMV